MVVAAVCACQFHHGVVSHDGGGSADGPGIDAPKVDAMVAAIDSQPDAPPPCVVTGLQCGGQVTSKTCNGGCWVFCNDATPVVQSVARARCLAWGGELAPILDSNDQACVHSFDPANQIWIGYEQPLNQATPATGWSFNGVTITQPNWDTGEPNDSAADGIENNQENCAYMKDTGKWNDTPCGEMNRTRFACRR
jgi:hypothetical protein